MANFQIHLAIGKRYLEKSRNIENVDAFYEGIIAPDLNANKDASHYTDLTNRDTSNLFDYLSKKIQLKDYIEQEWNNSDYQKGVFLHLITDYLFFNDFFDRTYLSKVTYRTFCEDLYFSYEKSNKYIEGKYRLELEKLQERINNNIKQNKKNRKLDDTPKNNILENQRIDAFIERVSSIDLEKYKEKILQSNQNVLP